MTPLQPNPIHQLIRLTVFKTITIFYRQVEVYGREHIPSNEAVIFVLNHPNGLIDPVLLMTVVDRPISFLAKSTLFGNPIGNALMQAFGALPIYRKRDEGLLGGPQGDSNERNEATFAQCRALLQHGGAMALFPEGTTHSAPQLFPLKTGAARIALSAVAETQGLLNLKIVPVGLWYENKALFRTSVLLVVGQPFELHEYYNHYLTDEVEAVQALTNTIDLRLDEVVLQAENAELLAGIPYIAEWTEPNLTLPQQHAKSAQLLQMYKVLRQQEPERLEQFAQAARDYAKTLYRLGISDPWALEIPPANRLYGVQLGLGLALFSPFFLLGFLLNYIPYRLATPLATLIVGRDDTQISTVKFIGGSLLVLLAWVMEGLMVSYLFNEQWGLLLFLAAPFLAYITLLWGERWREFYGLMSCSWLRWQKQAQVQSLIAQRQALTQQIIQAQHQVKSR